MAEVALASTQRSMTATKVAELTTALAAERAALATAVAERDASRTEAAATATQLAVATTAAAGLREELEVARAAAAHSDARAADERAAWRTWIEDGLARLNRDDLT
jgi:hypothetical protein